MHGPTNSQRYWPNDAHCDELMSGPLTQSTGQGPASIAWLSEKAVVPWDWQQVAGVPPSQIETMLPKRSSQMQTCAAPVP